MPTMVRNRPVWLAFVCLTALCLFGACSPSVTRSDQEDEKNPYFQKAKKMYQNRDYKEAVASYRKAIEMDPNNAAAHLELGLLYEDKLQDYAYAIYHYRRYLELRPQTEKTELLKQFIDRSQLALAASLTNSPIESGEEIARLHQANSNLVQEVDFLIKQKQEMEQKLVQLQNTPNESHVVKTNVVTMTNWVTQVAAAIGGGQSSGNNAPARPANPTTPASDTARVRTYVVVKGDTLSAISQKMYGRRDRWQLIYNANRSSIGPKYNLKVGQKLTIPSV